MKIRHYLVILSVFLTACSSIDPDTGERQDPLEGFNRTMWKVNYEVLDPYLVKPVAQGWKNYIPKPIKSGLINVANNLDEPASFVNRLLEGEGEKAMVHFTRFWINTFLGLGGLFDIASYSEQLKLENGNRKFGDVLGKYHVPTGPYIVLPFYGPATPRQDLGGVVDQTYPVLSMLTFPFSISKFLLQAIDKRANLIDQESLLNQSTDTYLTVREAYFQHLDFKIKDGNVEPEQELLNEEELKNID